MGVWRRPASGQSCTSAAAFDSSSHTLRCALKCADQMHRRSRTGLEQGCCAGSELSIEGEVKPRPDRCALERVPVPRRVGKGAHERLPELRLAATRLCPPYK